MRKNVFVIVVLCALFSSGVACAQRLVPGQWDLNLGLVGWEQYGGSIDFDKVDYNHKMVCRVGGYFYREAYDVGAHKELEVPDPARYMLRAVDVYGSWGMLWRIVSNRSRSVNLWGGVVGDVGARLRKPLAELDINRQYRRSDLYHIDVEEGLEDDRIPSASFLLGVTPELNFEVFPARNFSISLFFRSHLQWCTGGSGNGREDIFIPHAGIGFHYYLFVGK